MLLLLLLLLLFYLFIFFLQKCFKHYFVNGNDILITEYSS